MHFHWIILQETFSRDFNLSSIRQLIFAGTIVFFLLGIFILLLVVIYRNRRNRMLQEKEDMKNAFQQTLLQSQLEIQEQTLKTISQEIHDNVGQVLTLAKLNLSTTVLEDEQAASKIKTTQQLIAKAIQDLRDLSRSLNTDYVEEMGLVRSIEYELEMLKKTETLETNFSITGKVLRLDKQKELILFRIVQEAIHNIVKHAEAKTILASIQFSNEELGIRIQDDGKGFDLELFNDVANQPSGLGLRNMKSRAKLVGANFSMKSTIGSGTDLYISLPLNGYSNETKSEN